MKYTYTDVMLDTETLSLHTTAAIIQLAAVPFSISDAYIAPPNHRFSSMILPSAYPLRGYDVSTGTMEWWGQQDAELRKSVFCGTNLPHETAHHFGNWVKTMQENGNFPEDLKHLRVWARNVLFDLPVIKNFLEQDGEGWPFHYRAHRELYQELDGVPQDVQDNFSKNPAWHNAASDALYQAKNACEARTWKITGELPEW